MAVKKFINFIKSIKSSNAKIIILGRGSSSRFFLNNIHKIKTKNDLLIGYNTNEIFNEVDFYFTNKNYYRTEKTIFYRDLIKKLSKNFFNLKIGNTNFGIFALLFFINFFSRKKIKVYLWGFDFRSSNINSDYNRKKNLGNFYQKEITIKSQKIFFSNIKKFFKKIDIYLFGFNYFSDYDPRNYTFEKQEPSRNIKITAEITTNHFGKNFLIKKLIKHASEAGADYVKFQLRNVETFYSQEELNRNFNSPFGKTFRDYRNGLELNNSQITLIKKLCKKYKIKPFFSVLDIQSFEKILKYKFSLIKIPSTISEDKKFLKYVSKNYKGEIVISIGMTNKSYINEIIKRFSKCKKVYILHCISSYPAFVGDLNIAVISYIKKLSDKYKFLVPGYSSHDLTTEASIMAIAAGAKMIEKHIRYEENRQFHFNDAALDVETEFKDYVYNLRLAERIYGNEEKKILKSEHHKYSRK
jgi:N-acetylneuraminate synthase